MQNARVNDVTLDVNRTISQDVQLKVGATTQEVTVTAEAPVIESTTMTVGKVLDQNQVQNMLLNGRHFMELAQLAPGTVVPPANGFLTGATRGQGALSV